jgi:large subunit ribosomal protein L7/L12
MSARIEEIVSQLSTMTAKELSELVKNIEQSFGVSAAVAVSAAPAAGAAVAEEKSEYKVTLKDVGANKINVIKALRQVVQGLGLTEAKKMVDEAPAVVKDSVPKDEAKKMKEVIEAAGAKVELA